MADSDINEIFGFVKSLKLTRAKLKEVAINLYFLKLGLKPSILWDFGLIDISKLLKLQPLFEDTIVIIKIEEDIILTLKARIEVLSFQLQEVSPVIVDISSILTEPEVILEKDLINSLITMVIDVVSVSKSGTMVVNVPNNGNVSTLFGLLLGFPFVYYYREEDNCLGHRDLMLVRVRAIWENRTFTPISFSVPKYLWFKEGLEIKLKNWWSKLSGIEWGTNLCFDKVNILVDLGEENRPVVIL